MVRMKDLEFNDVEERVIKVLEGREYGFQIINYECGWAKLNLEFCPCRDI